MEAMAGDKFLQKFRLYETRSKFYLIGRDKTRTLWRVLKIDRMEPTELEIEEDHTSYTENECQELLWRIHEGNRLTGGLKFVTKCYGIVGFIKFLGPYYMVLITRRRKVGTICGHEIYSVGKSELIAIPSPIVWPNVAYSRDENRYKRLLCSVDLSKDFFFSYSYNIMRSLQKNITDKNTGQVVYETMFVWNEFLSRAIRNHLKNTTWTVALIHGFFKQSKLSVAGKEFWLTLIARRSRHFAGTRFLKRGVNEKGRVANDVETEQIVFEDTPDEIPHQISSVVQHRGSIPLIWFQETSRLNIRPDIILKPDVDYKTTRLHFENLALRYGNPIIILNLIKTREKKPRESLLRAEFAKAIHYINKGLPDDKRLKFLHMDLSKLSRRKGTNVLSLLNKVASDVLDLTDFLHCEITTSKYEDASSGQGAVANSGDIESIQDQNLCATKLVPLLLQKGVLRTNCIDCLDRTNVAQFAYGLAAVGRQLHVLQLNETPTIELHAPLADDLMDFYERMGDTLAIQYGGSAAHNKIFCEQRGQWKAATQSQEFLRTLQRYYSNAYTDPEKQDSINVFLGHFQPQEGKPALWKLDSDQHYNIGRQGTLTEETGSRSFIKRSLSDGNILCDNTGGPVSDCNVGKNNTSSDLLPMQPLEDIREPSDSAPEISIEPNPCSSTNYSTLSGRHSISEERQNYLRRLGYPELHSSNFLDLDLLSSSGNSCEEEIYERSSLINSPMDVVSIESTTSYSEQGHNDEQGRDDTDLSRSSSQMSDIRDYSDRFAHWVDGGGMLCY
ncbi:phosphoinositide phosphatase SAC2 isoform X1 [Oryza glaberrima]|uniref:phosphoinositide phosphatase SAC2 isoform X1 n=1 Tax=Oryza glaberrima TaxID=4538 RepID=UPI00224BF423|nr:phosphoinositide phosphatase SAC2 isoform X1 [Oryza glaberrima]